MSAVQTFWQIRGAHDAHRSGEHRVPLPQYVETERLRAGSSGLQSGLQMESWRAACGAPLAALRPDLSPRSLAPEPARPADIDEGRAGEAAAGAAEAVAAVP